MEETINDNQKNEDTNSKKYLDTIDIDRMIYKLGKTEILDLRNQHIGANTLSNTSLKGANLSGLDLRKRFIVGTDLSGADLSRVDLREASLRSTNLTGADLSNADLRQATFYETGARQYILNDKEEEYSPRKVSLNKANLQDAKLQGVSLVGINLSETRFCNADLSQTDLRKAKLRGASLRQANLQKANLSGVDLLEVDLTGADLSEANLSRANLTRARLNGALLNKADLSNAILNRADLQDTILNSTNLSNAQLRFANLQRAQLNEVDLASADLSEANLKDAQITFPDLHGTNLKGTILNTSESSAQIVNVANANPANIQEVAAPLLAISNKYYESALQQSQRSFFSALIWASIGTSMIIAAIIFLLIRQSSNLSYVSLIGGAIVEAIASLNFFLYGKASNQLTAFQMPLDRMGRFLIANSVCENIEGDIKHSTRAKLVETISNAEITMIRQIKRGNSRKESE